MDEEFWELVSVAQNRASAKLVTPAEPVRPTRKIVQISTTGDMQWGVVIVGLADDGTVLIRRAVTSADEPWDVMPPIPQPEGV
jgi:hypothetical protein